MGVIFLLQAVSNKVPQGKAVMGKDVTQHHLDGVTKLHPIPCSQRVPRPQAWALCF